MGSFITTIFIGIFVSGITIIGLLYIVIYRNGKYLQDTFVNNDPKRIKVFSNDIVDIVRASWSKSVMSEFGENGCHLFDYIKRQQGSTLWGSILDAGTGSHSLDELLSLNSDSLTAVTGDPKRQKAMQRMFKKRLRPQDEVVSGNWKDPKFLEGRVFDVVLADYLLGSLDAFAPYFQDKLFERLRPHVGKKLYVVGIEPFPDHAESNPHAQLLIEISKARDSCILLAGDRPYREYPLDWVIRNLKQNHYKIEAIGTFETTYTQDFVEMQINVAESKLGRFKNEDMVDTMQAYLDVLRKRVHRLSWDIKYGSDYIIVASPIRHHKHSVEQESDIELPSYRSPVQEQSSVFPIDEE